MLPNNNKTWKDWVDWAPTYWILGGSLAYVIHQTGILPTLLDKFTKKDETNSSQTNQEQEAD